MVSRLPYPITREHDAKSTDYFILMGMSGGRKGESEVVGQAEVGMRWCGKMEIG